MESLTILKLQISDLLASCLLWIKPSLTKRIWFMSNVALPAILHLKFFMELGTIKNVTYLVSALSFSIWWPAATYLAVILIKKFLLKTWNVTWPKLICTWLTWAWNAKHWFFRCFRWTQSSDQQRSKSWNMPGFHQTSLLLKNCFKLIKKLLRSKARILLLLLRSCQSEAWFLMLKMRKAAYL